MKQIITIGCGAAVALVFVLFVKFFPSGFCSDNGIAANRGRLEFCAMMYAASVQTRGDRP
jgi:hypothetical protein